MNQDEEAFRMEQSLSEIQRDCLSFWPNGYFPIGTKAALRRMGLVHGNKLTNFGERVKAQTNERG